MLKNQLKSFTTIAAISLMVLSILLGFVLFYLIWINPVGGNERIDEPQELSAGVLDYPYPVKEFSRNFIFTLPEKITFAGMEIPQDSFWLRGQLEKEWLGILEGHERDDFILWILKSTLYFPIAERELAAKNVPDDLKFILPVESNLRARASSEYAVGLAQFVEGTARSLDMDVKIEINDHWDARRDPVMAIKAMAHYLNYLYHGDSEMEGFHNWFAVICAYNAGWGNIMNAMKEQGEESVFNLYLFYETRRYLARVLIFKVLYENREKLFGIEETNYYQYPEFDTIVLGNASRLHLAQLTDWVDSNFRWMVEMNPSVDVNLARGARERFSAYIPPGHRLIRIPKGTQEKLKSILENQTSRGQLSWRGQTETIVINDPGMLYNARLRYRVSDYQVGAWIRDIFFLNQSNEHCKGNPDLYIVDVGASIDIPKY